MKIRFVGNVPVELSYYKHGCDDAYLRKRPGLYPDSLLELKKNEIEFIPTLWHSLWITVDTKGQIPAGIYELNVVFEGEGMKLVKTLKVKILKASLPKQSTILANWFHTDCLASLYNVKMYSKKHWQIIEDFMKCAIENGVNSIYTPLFSIPLDTNPGTKRPACQLIDITEARYGTGKKQNHHPVRCTCLLIYKYAHKRTHKNRYKHINGKLGQGRQGLKYIV